MNALRNIQILLFITLFNAVNLDAQSRKVIVPFQENDKWGFMNEDKEVVVSPIYDLAYPPHNGVARIKLGDRYGFVNMSGELIGRVKYTSATDFQRGVAKVEHRGKSYFIKTDGKRNKTQGAYCGHHVNCVRPNIHESVEIISDGGKLGIVFERAYRDELGRLQYEPDTIPP